MDKSSSPINIVVVALSENFSKVVASSLSSKLDMFLVDCHEMIVYDLVNPKEVIEKCGLEYFKKREKSVLKNCSQFHDTVISISYELLKEYRELFSNSYIFYVKLPKDKIEQVPSNLAYESRDVNLKNVSKENIIELEKRSSVQAVNKIINRLGEYYENC